MFSVLAPLLGTITRLPKVIQLGLAVYATGAVVSATKSVLNGDSAGTVAKRASKSWLGMSRSIPLKHSHKKALKKAADRLKRTPTAANVKKAAATAKAAGVTLPPGVTAAINQV